MLCQELADGSKAVLHFQLGCLDFALAKLHLQQVVAVDGSHAYHIRYVFLQLLYHVVKGSKGLHLLLQRYHLPVVLLGGEFHVVSRHLHLQFAGLDTDLRQLVAIDDLATHEDGLNGGNGAVDTLLHQADVGRNQAFRYQVGEQIRHFDVNVNHGLVVLKCKTQSRYMGKVLRQRLALHLLRLLDSVAGRAEVVVVLDGQLLQLLKRINALSS